MVSTDSFFDTSNPLNEGLLENSLSSGVDEENNFSEVSQSKEGSSSNLFGTEEVSLIEQRTIDETAIKDSENDSSIFPQSLNTNSLSQSLLVEDGNDLTGADTVVADIFPNLEALEGDADSDRDLDFDDVRLITAARNTNATEEDVRDLDGDGLITVLDARKLVVTLRRNSDFDVPEVSFALENDSGILDNDGITNDLSISGLIGDVSPVTSLKAGFDNILSEDYTQIAGILNEDGSFALNQSQLEIINNGALGEGEHTLYLQAKDKWANQAETATLSFTLDKTAPELELTEPLADSAINADSQLTGTVEEDVTSLSYRFNDGEAVEVVVTDGSFAQNFDLTGLLEGENSLTLIATDAAGNVTEETITVSLEVDPGDVTPPVITADLATDTGSNETDGVTSDPKITGSVTDDIGVSSLKANLGETEVDITDVIEIDGSFTLDAAKLAEINGGNALADGAYTLNLVAKDEVGNEATSDVFFALDTAAPEIGIFEPLADSIINADSQLRVVITDEQTTAVTYRFGDGEEIEVAVNDGEVASNLDVTGLTEGINTITVTVTDAAGNVTKETVTVDFQPNPGDVTPPVITADLATDTGSDETDDITSDPTITGSVSDNVAVASLKANLGGTEVDITDAVGVDGSFTLNAEKLAEINGGNALADGDYTLNIVATDEAGNEADSSVSFTLDTTAPELELSEPLADSTINADSQLVGTVTENTVTLTYRLNDGEEIEVAITEGIFAQNIDLSAVVEGENSLTFVATDTAGNVTEETITVSLEVDPGDVTPPVISADLATDTGSDDADGVTNDPTVTGSVSDNVAVTSLTASLGRTEVDITDAIEADGSFTLNADQLAEINGGNALADGAYTLELVATDEAGNEATSDVSFTLDTAAATASVLTNPRPDDTRIQVVFNEAVTGDITEAENYTLTGIDGEALTINSVTRVNSTTVRLNLASALVTGNYQLEIAGDIQDSAGNAASTQSLNIRVAAKPIEIAPFNGETLVTLTRETIVRFGKKVNPETVTRDSFYAIANGQRIPGRIVVSSTEEFATLFYDEPLPQSTEVRVVVEGDSIIGRDGVAVDGDKNGTPGGRATADFTTLPLTQIEGTDVFGYVYDAYNTNEDGSNIPLEGVIIRLDALPNVFAVTDENGYFILENVPAPEFYVYIDGSEVVGAEGNLQYASLGKAFHSVPGEAVRLEMDGEDFDIYLPPMAVSDVVELSTTEDTEVGFGEASLARLQEDFPDIDPEVWTRTQVTYPAGSAQNDQGEPATRGIIVPVQPDRLPAPLPPTVDPQLVISVQAGGEQGFNREVEGGATNFDVPAPVQFPNLEGLAPGEKSLLWSFNHDAGDWEIVGTGTVSDDGLTIESDEGVGIEAPGWHFTQPGTPTNGPDGSDDPDDDCDPEFFTWENAIDLYEQATKCAANFFKIRGAIAALFDIVSEGKSLLNSAKELGKQIGEGELDAEAIQAALQTINSSKKILKRGFDEIKDQNPVGKALAISKCLEGLLGYATTVCDRIRTQDSDCDTITVRTVCRGLDLARSLLGQTNTLIEKAQDGLSETVFALICTTIDKAQALAGLAGVNNNQQLLAFNAVSTSQPILTNEDAQTDIDKDALVTELNLLVTQLEGFLDSTEASAEVGAILDEATQEIGDIAPEVNQLYSEFIGYPADAYYLIEYNDFQVRGRTDNNGRLSVVLPPSTEYTISMYDPGTNRIASNSGVTNASGSQTTIPALSFVTTGGIADVIEDIGEELTDDIVEGLTDVELNGLPDTDADGLVDEAERIIGTLSDNQDTDADGIDDLAEIEQRLDPLGGQGFPTGIISSLPLFGEAKAVTVEGSTENTRQQVAYVATGSHGLAIVDASQFNNPIVLGQLNLTGDATDVAVDSSLGIAAVATNSGGLQLVDVSDPMLPTLIQSVALNANKVEVADGVAYATTGTSLRAIDILTGEEIESVTLPGSGTVTDLAIDGTQLYSYTSGSDIFAAVDISNPGSPTLLGETQVSIASSAVGISAGNGVAFLAGSGLSTVDISDPSDPSLIQGADSFFTARDISRNGSGLGIVAAEGQGLAVYNTANPEDTDDFLTVFDTPGFTYDAAIASGIAYVADGRGGLQVINYLGFDNQGVAPTVSISSSADLDPDTAAVEVLEGSSVPIQVDVSDDVQVRNVALLVNGEVVDNDVSFPFDLRAIALADSPEGTTVDVQVRANDTGGNTSLSNLLTFNIVPDTFAPEVTSTTPKADTRRRGINGISVRFNEGIDANLVSLAGVTLTNLGTDGAIGGGDDTVVTPQDVQVSESGRSLFVIPPEDSEFIPGDYQLRLDPSIISDRAGNALESAFTLDFTKRSQSDPVGLGETISDTFFADDEDQIFTFTGAAGQRIYFDGISGNFSVDASLVSPSGVNLFSFQNVNSDQNPLTLIENGTYQLKITSSSTTNEDYSFRLLDATAEELTLDSLTEGTLDPGATTDLFSFEATAGQKFYLDGQGDTFNGSYIIYNQVNQAIASRTFGFDTEFTVTADGTYLLALQAFGTEAVDYSFNLLTPETTATEALTIGETVTGNIGEPGEEDVYTFTGSAGQKLYFDGLNNDFFSISTSLISPSGQNVLFSSNVSSDRNPVTLIESGTYELKVDGSGETTGDYSFRLLDIADATALTLDEVTTGTLATGTNTDLFTFTASAGDKFYLDGQGDTFNGTYRIYNRANQNIVGTTFGFDTEFTVTSDGTYLFAAQGSGTEAVDYSFNLITTEDTAVEALTIGEAVTGNISKPGAEELYTFTGSAGQRIYFDGLNNDFVSINASLISPSGQNVLFSSNVSSDRNPVTLIESGTYELRVDGNGATTGDYSFRVLDVADATELTLDTLTEGTLDPGTNTDLFTFTASAGDKFYLDGQGDTFSGSYVIYNQANRSITSSTFGFDREFTVTSDGTYLFAAQGSGTEAVDYSFNLITTEDTAVEALTIGETVTGNISEPGVEELYTFTGATGQKLYLDGVLGESNIFASLVSPSGQNIFFSNFVGSDSNPVTLIENGDYQLKVDGSGASTGDYSFRVLDFANATEFNLGQTISENLDPNTSDILQFEAKAGQTLLLDGMGTEFGGSYSIYNTGDRLITSQTFGFDRQFTITNDGTYFLLAQSSDNEAIDYNFQITEVSFEEPPAIDSTPLTIGETVIGSIAEIGEEDIYTFAASAGQTLYFDGITGDFRIDAYLTSPSGQNIFSFGNVSSDRNFVTLIESGTYQLRIDGSASTTGDYSFRVLDFADATELTLDEITTDTLANGTSTNLFKFDAKAGDKFYLDELTDESFRVFYTVYGQANQFVTSTSSDSEFTVTADGTYFLAAQGSGTEALDYSFNLITPKVDTATLTIGETVTGSIAEPGEEDIYTFTGNAGQTLYFDGITGDFRIDAYLTSPSGQNTFFSSNVGSDRNFATLIESGTYQLRIDGSGANTGDYSFRVLDFADATELTFDEVTTGTLSNGTNTDLFTFTATAGDKFYLDGQGDTFNGSYIVYNQANQFVASQTFGFDREFTITADGTYLFAAQGSGTEAIDYSFNLITIEDTSVEALTIGEIVTGSIIEPGAEELYTFTGTAGQTLYFDGITGNFSIDAYLTSPSGQNTFFSSNVGSDRNFATLIESGTYQLRIDGSGANTGDYSFRVLDFADATELTFDAVTTDTLANGTNTNLFKFDAKAGDKFYLDELTDDANRVSYAVYGQANQFITSTSSDREFTVTADGTYYLAAQGSGTEALDYSFNLITPKINTATLTLGNLVMGNITEAGEEDIYTFTGTAGQTLYFDGINGNSSIDVFLTSPSGQNLLNFQNVNSNNNPITLIENGTYQLRVDGSGVTTGDYSFLLSDTNRAADLNFNSTIRNTLEANTSRVFKFSGTKNQNISFEDLGSEFGGTFRLFGPGNQTITSRSFRSEFEVTLPGDGVYALVLENSRSNSINYAFRIV